MHPTDPTTLAQASLATEFATIANNITVAELMALKLIELCSHLLNYVA